MAKSANQKLKILYLMRMFMEQTDEDHSISINDMIVELNRYDIEAERKSLYADIENLKTYGLDIEVKKSKKTNYYLASRNFELAELKLLVDAVQCSKFVTHKKSSELIKKIESLTSKKQALNLQRQVYVANRVKGINENIYYNVDCLHTAIAENKKISFKYFDYTVDKEKLFRKSGGRYYASPITLSWNDENYYLIVYYAKHRSFVHYRVDRMSNIEILDQPRDEIHEDENFNIADYTKKVFSMFGGEDEIVRLQFKNSLVNQVIDRFGSDINIEKVDQESFMVRIPVKVSSPFFSWVAQFGADIKIISPENVKEKFIENLSDIIKQYQ